MITSMAFSEPLSVCMPLRVIAVIGSVMSSTLGLVSVGYQASVGIMRLQPTSSMGVTLRRSSGSLIVLVIWWRASPRKAGLSQGLLVKASVPNS